VSFHELINLSELFAGHQAVAEGAGRAGFGEKRARPSPLSLVRLVSRLACAGVAAICPLPKMVTGFGSQPIRLDR
jgi:hypothetical protein